VDHATIQRWVYKFTAFIASEMKKRKVKVGLSWRLDETYIKVRGIWCYLHRVVDKLGHTGYFFDQKKTENERSVISN
jgi:putative transposase